LHTPEEKPEDRQDFKHPNLLNWVAENRPRLAVAAITILRAYFVAACPKVDSTTWGSFESWTATIRGALVWTGLACPLTNRQHANRSDESRTLLGLLVTGLLESGNQGLTAKEMEHVSDSPAMKEAITLICPQKFNARSLAKKLSGFRGRRWQNYEISYIEGHGGVRRWFSKATSGGNGYNGDSVSNPSQYEKQFQPDIRNAYAYRDRPETEPPKPPLPPSTGIPVMYEVEL